MNVRIFWVRVMKCMCAQTRPRFILSSERVFGGMELEPMLTPREKSPLPENFPRGGSNPQRCGQRAQTLPKSYSGPLIASKWENYKSSEENIFKLHWVCSWKLLCCLSVSICWQSTLQKFGQSTAVVLVLVVDVYFHVCNGYIVQYSFVQ